MRPLLWHYQGARDAIAGRLRPTPGDVQHTMGPAGQAVDLIGPSLMSAFRRPPRGASGGIYDGLENGVIAPGGAMGNPDAVTASLSGDVVYRRIWMPSLPERMIPDVY